MRLLLIRHGETVDNVGGIYAGIRDSPLTTHGVLQASRLASHLAQFKISRIFSSDLQRAFKTAEAVRLAQSQPPKETVKVVLLREQDFGFYEGKSFLERPKGVDKSGKEAQRAAHAKEPGFKDVESKESMDVRSEEFIDAHLVESFLYTGEDALNEVVVVVAHGIILAHLWRAVLRRFGDEVDMNCRLEHGRGLEHLGGWSNTGYLDLEIKVRSLPDRYPGSSMLDPPRDAPMPPMVLSIRGVDCKVHLQGLKRTRGGIGSAKHDDKQRTVDSFFKKRKIG